MLAYIDEDGGATTIPGIDLTVEHHHASWRERAVGAAIALAVVGGATFGKKVIRAYREAPSDKTDPGSQGADVEAPNEGES